MKIFYWIVASVFVVTTFGKDAYAQDLKNDNCKWNGKWIEAGKWHEEDGKRCYCNMKGKLENCENLKEGDKCNWNGKWIEAGKWHEDDGERCYCNWKGNLENCEDLKGDKCRWNGNWYEAGKWHEDDGERCYCNMKGNLENCKDLNQYGGNCKTIAEIACERSTFSSLCDALDEADLFSTLDDTSTDFTVFAPNNKAFDDFLGRRGLDDINRSKLVRILLTHVISDRVLDRDDLKNRCSELIRMESDKKTRIICKNGKRNLYQKGEGNSDNDKPLIVDTNIKACNGIIHVVDEVILP